MKTLTYLKPLSAQVVGKLHINDERIPTSIRNYLVENRSRHITIALEDGTLWIASKHKVKMIRLDQYQRFQLSYMTPAKGGGFIIIEAPAIKAELEQCPLVDFGTYSEATFQSAVELATQLESILGYIPKQDYWGADC